MCHWVRLLSSPILFAFLRLPMFMIYCRPQYGIDEMCRDQWKCASSNPNGYQSCQEQSLDLKPTTNGNHEASIIKDTATWYLIKLWFQLSLTPLTSICHIHYQRSFGNSKQREQILARVSCRPILFQESIRVNVNWLCIVLGWFRIFGRIIFIWLEQGADSHDGCVSRYQGLSERYCRRLCSIFCWRE